MARVLRVGSPGLFDDTDDEPAVVTGYVHGEYVPAICETCGDFPEHLGITYVTRGGRPECETSPDFGWSVPARGARARVPPSRIR